MKQFPLNLSAFKKVSEDKHSATLLHPNGHKITLAKNALSEAHKKQLAKLPVHKAEGGEIDDSELDSGADRAPAGAGISVDADPEPPQGAQPGMIGAPSQQDSNPLSGIGYSSPFMPSMGQIASEISGSIPNHMGQNIPNQEQATQAQNPHIPAPAQAAPKVPQFPNVAGQMQANANRLAHSTEELGAAQGRSSQEMAGIHEHAASELSNLHQNVQDYFNRQLGDLDLVAKEMGNGTIRPNAWWEDKSTGGKISTAIGLLLGGIGGGLTGKENPALKFINDQINRNVEAQKAQFQNKNTLYHAYLNKFGNSMAAAKFSAAVQGQKIANDIMEQGYKSNDPVQQQQAKVLSDQIKAQAYQTVAPLIIQQSMLKALHENPQIDPSSAVIYLQKAGVMDENNAKTVNEELSHAKEMEAFRKELATSYNYINNMYMRGLMSPEMRNSQINLLAGKLSRMTAGRFNLEEATKQMDALMPARLEGSDTTSSKYQNIDRLIDLERANEHVGHGWGIEVPKGRASDIHSRKNIVPGYPRQ